MTTTNKPNTWFWVIGILALIWNLLGVFAYLAEAYMSDEILSALPAEQQALYAERPAWVTAAFAIAVFAGALGCIAMLIRKKLAASLFILSLLAVIAQQIYAFFLSNTMEVMGGASAMGMPIMIIVVAIFLVWYARRATTKGWLS